MILSSDYSEVGVDPELRIKKILKNKTHSIESLSDSIFRFVSDGQMYYTNGELVVSESDMNLVQEMMDRDGVGLPYPQETAYKAAFVNRANQKLLSEYGVKYIPLRKFIGQWQ